MDFCRYRLSDPDIREICRSLILLGGLCLAAYMDLRDRRISNRWTVSMCCAGSLLLVPEIGRSGNWTGISEAAAGFLLGGGLSLGCYLLFRGGIGAGDVKLFAVTGLCVGGTEILSVMALSVFLAAGGCVMLLVSGRAGRDTRVPYAPFVFLAVLIRWSGKAG